MRSVPKCQTSAGHPLLEGQPPPALIDVKFGTHVSEYPCDIADRQVRAACFRLKRVTSPGINENGYALIDGCPGIIPNSSHILP